MRRIISLGVLSFPAWGSVQFIHQHGSPFNSATRFAIEMFTDHDHERHFKALFNTGASDCWLERGAMSPMSYRDYETRESIGAGEKEEPSYTLVGGRLESVVPWAVRHQHHSTFKHGAGHLAAGIDSAFSKDFGEFTISPRLNDDVTEFSLSVGPKDESVGWFDSPVVFDETTKWIVDGSLEIIGISEIPVTLSLDTSLRGISLPSEIYTQYVSALESLGISTSKILEALMAETSCDHVPSIWVTIGDVRTELAVGESLREEGSCMVWVQENVKGAYIEVGEIFFAKHAVHFDSLKRIVSIAV